MGMDLHAQRRRTTQQNAAQQQQRNGNSSADRNAMQHSLILCFRCILSTCGAHTASSLDHRTDNNNNHDITVKHDRSMDKHEWMGKVK